MENLTTFEMMHEDGHLTVLPTYDEMIDIYTALQEVTGSNKNGNEGFYSEHSLNPSALMFTDEDDIWHTVTAEQYQEVAERVGVNSDYVEEWAVEFCDGKEGRCWGDLRDE